MLDPIVARPGEVLTIWPGHPELTLCVFTPDGETPIRWRHHPEGALYGDLLALYLDAKIRGVSDRDERLLTQSA